MGCWPVGYVKGKERITKICRNSLFSSHCKWWPQGIRIFSKVPRLVLWHPAGNTGKQGKSTFASTSSRSAKGNAQRSTRCPLARNESWQNLRNTEMQPWTCTLFSHSPAQVIINRCLTPSDCKTWSCLWIQTCHFLLRHQRGVGLSGQKSKSGSFPTPHVWQYTLRSVCFFWQTLPFGTILKEEKRKVSLPFFKCMQQSIGLLGELFYGFPGKLWAHYCLEKMNCQLKIHLIPALLCIQAGVTHNILELVSLSQIWSNTLLPY